MSILVPYMNLNKQLIQTDIINGYIGRKFDQTCPIKKIIGLKFDGKTKTATNVPSDFDNDIQSYIENISLVFDDIKFLDEKFEVSIKIGGLYICNIKNILVDLIATEKTINRHDGLYYLHLSRYFINPLKPLNCHGLLYTNLQIVLTYETKPHICYLEVDYRHSPRIDNVGYEYFIDDQLTLETIIPGKITIFDWTNIQTPKFPSYLLILWFSDYGDWLNDNGLEFFLDGVPLQNSDQLYSKKHISKNTVDNKTIWVANFSDLQPFELSPPGPNKYINFSRVDDFSIKVTKLPTCHNDLILNLKIVTKNILRSIGGLSGVVLEKTPNH